MLCPIDLSHNCQVYWLGSDFYNQDETSWPFYNFKILKFEHRVWNEKQNENEEKSEGKHRSRSVSHSDFVLPVGERSNFNIEDLHQIFEFMGVIEPFNEIS